MAGAPSPGGGLTGCREERPCMEAEPGSSGAAARPANTKQAGELLQLWLPRLPRPQTEKSYLSLSALHREQ